MVRIKIKNAAHLMSQILECDEGEAERRLTASAPADEDLDAWLSRLKEAAFQTALARNRLTEQFLLSVHTFEGEESLSPLEGVAPHRVPLGICS